MRVLIAATLFICVILLISESASAKKTHSDRKKRSDVDNLPSSNKQKILKHHQKSKDKKRRSIDEANVEAPASEEHDGKHKKSNREEKSKRRESELINEDVETGEKHQSDKSQEKREKHKKIRKEGKSNGDVDHVGNDVGGSDPPSTSSSSEIKGHAKKKKNQKVEKEAVPSDPSTDVDENSDGDNQPKDKKVRKSKKNSKYVEKNKCKSKKKNDNSSWSSGEAERKKYKHVKNKNQGENSRVTRDIELGQEEIDDVVPEENAAERPHNENKKPQKSDEASVKKERSSRSAENFDPDEEEGTNEDEQIVQEVCVKEATDENEDSSDKLCSS